MSIIEKLVVCLYFFAIICWQAFHQAQLFKEQKTISHFWKGVWYGCAIVAATIPAVIVCGWWRVLEVPVIAILERMAFFDFILNIVRKKPLFYNGDKSTGSLIDRLENNLSEDALPAYKISWVIIFVLLIIGIK